MDAIKRLILLHIPISQCNLRCKYCYITIQQRWKNPPASFRLDSEGIAKAFSRERLGGVCFFNICASGETLLPSFMLGYIRAILSQGHYVEVVTNGTLTGRFDAIAQFPQEYLERLTFKFSFHYKELKERGLLDIYFANIKKMRDCGASFTCEMTPTDDLEGDMDEIKEIVSKHLGAYPHLTIARNDIVKGTPVLSKHSLDEYVQIWSSFDSGMMQFKKTIYMKKRKEFCYAGAWSAYINAATGDMRKCYCDRHPVNIYDDLDSPIPFKPIGICREDHCYNGHALLTFGVIPKIDVCTYDFIRNRECADGSSWIQPRMKAFMQTKLKDQNDKLSYLARLKIRTRPFRNALRKKIHRSTPPQ